MLAATRREMEEMITEPPPWPSTTSGPPIEGTPPKSRVTILQWESIEQLNAYRKSAAFVDARKIGDKYAKFRTFAIEGMPQ